ncbi:MAG: agmatinase [Bacteroidia bacterium]|nr:agmatinase [Bacteroidia bacterium]
MIYIQGISYDDKSSYQRGAKLAPPLIRKALYSESSNLFAENGVSLSSLDMADKGDFLIPDYFDIETTTKANLEDKSPIFTLGGDHSITYPVIRAISMYYPQIDILHIDAHADLYDEFEGDKYSHACPFARIMEEGLAKNLVQVGIRTLSNHQREQVKKFGVKTLELRDWELSKLPYFENPLYISLDMDAFDPAYAPGVSHYEPGGFTARQVLQIIQQLKGNIVGADIVEYNPTKDHHDMTAFLAAKMMKEILVRMA